MTGRPLRTSCVFIGAGAVVLAVLTSPRCGRRSPSGGGARSARFAEPLRPRPQGLRRHRAQHRLEGLVHRRRRGPVRRLRADHRQHERPHAAVRRHRRALVHRPADPRPDLHGPQPTAPAWPARSPPPARRTATASPPATSPTRPATASLMRTRSSRGRHARGLQGVRPARRASSTATAAAAAPTAAPTAAWSTASGDPGRLRPEHRHPGDQPRLRRADLHGADRRPAGHGLGRATPTPPPTASPASTPRTASRRTPSAPDGHVVATEEVTPRHGTRAFTLALGFGRDPGRRRRARAGPRCAGRSTATRACLRADVDVVRRRACGSRAASPASRPTPTGSAPTWCRSSVDKTFPGAIVGGLASPWGQAVSAGDLPGGKPVYFGSYREVFARDLYEAVHRPAGRRATWRPPGPRPGSCSSASSCPTAACRATRCSTARPPPTPAASSSTRRRTRS